MKRAYGSFIMCLSIMLVLLIGCSSLETPQDTEVPSSTLAPLFSVEPSGTITDPLATIMADPTYQALYASAEQTTDGKIMLTIKVAGSCNDRNIPFKIYFTLQNISNSPILIDSDLTVASGSFEVEHIIPVLYTEDGSRLFPSDDFYPRGDTGFSAAATPVALELGPQERYEFQRDFLFPEYVLDGTQWQDSIFITPVPGQYSLKFIYQNYNRWAVDVWIGIIASNQVEICLLR